MRLKLRAVIIIFILFFVQLAKAQLNAPSLRCVSVNSANGDVTLSWIIPPDPTSIFTRYEIYHSTSLGGPYNLVGNVTTYAQNNYVHAATTATNQSQFYYITTVSNSTNSSAPSDTLQTLFLNLVNLPTGIAVLNWNAMHNPLLSSSATTYTLSRQSPPGAYMPVYVGSTRSYKDTITLCSVFYNYKVEISDASGCVSVSNIKGDFFQNKYPPNLPLLDSVSVNTNGTVSLGWEPSSSQDVMMYYIYKETTGGIWQVIDSVSGYNNTSYTYNLAGASSGSENYCISARDSCRNVSILGNDQAQKTIYLDLKYQLCSRSVDLTWTPYVNLPKGVVRYDIYRSVNGSAFSIVGSTSNAFFTNDQLSPGNTYCYFVKVWNSTNAISASSNQACILANAPSGPAYVYIRSVSVNMNQKIEVTYVVDTLKDYNGAIIFKSEDGITFNQLRINYSNNNFIETILDEEVNTSDKNYYYKIQLIDSCGNPGPVSNISKSVLLKVTHDKELLFVNKLKWDDYSSWLANVESYNIYRAVNGIFDGVPIANVSTGTREYDDNIEDFARDQGKFEYYVEPIEGPGNPFGFKDFARSNIASAYVEGEVFVPNAFAPKGLNNVWLPVAQFVEKTDYKVTVLNRWGNKVFQTTDDTIGWDGRNATDDVYVYFIEYKNARGEFVQLKGHLNLVK